MTEQLGQLELMLEKVVQPTPQFSLSIYGRTQKSLTPVVENGHTYLQLPLPLKAPIIDGPLFHYKN